MTKKKDSLINSLVIFFFKSPLNVKMYTFNKNHSKINLKGKIKKMLDWFFIWISKYFFKKIWLISFLTKFKMIHPQITFNEAYFIKDPLYAMTNAIHDVFKSFNIIVIKVIKKCFLMGWKLNLNILLYSKMQIKKFKEQICLNLYHLLFWRSHFNLFLYYLIWTSDTYQWSIC